MLDYVATLKGNAVPLKKNINYIFMTSDEHLIKKVKVIAVSHLSI